MEVIIITLAPLVLLFGFVVWFGAPYVPTLKPQTQRALDLLDLKPGQTLLELGCGDGRVMRAAAQRGLTVIGYELNPVLVLAAKLHTWKYRKQVKVIWGNYWKGSWPQADGIFVFLLDKYMDKLDKIVVQKYPHRPVKLASYAFRIPKRKHHAKSSGVFLYIYK